jgi:hypothetical protein
MTICKYCLKEQGRGTCEECDVRMSRMFGLMHRLMEYKPLPPMRIPSLDIMQQPKKEPKKRKTYTRKVDVIPWPAKKKSA